MLERYYVRPDSIDRIRSAWIGAPIEKYVEWLTKQGYAARTVLRRTPLLMQFGEFARQRGATTLEELPSQVEAFALHWLEKHGQGCKTDHARAKVMEVARNPVDQMLALVIPGYQDQGRSKGSEPFQDAVPGFFDYLRKERGLEERLKRRLTDLEQEIDTYARLDWEEKVKEYVADLQTGIEELNNAVPKDSRRATSCLSVEKTTGG